VKPSYTPQCKLWSGTFTPSGGGKTVFGGNRLSFRELKNNLVSFMHEIIPEMRSNDMDFEEKSPQVFDC
jgi:hypothetical protein